MSRALVDGEAKKQDDVLRTTGPDVFSTVLMNEKHKDKPGVVVVSRWSSPLWWWWW